MNYSYSRIFPAFALGAILAMVWSGPQLAAQDAGQTPHVFQLSGDFWGTHDPSIMKEGNTWYVFATGRAPPDSYSLFTGFADVEALRAGVH
jgi:hypothetical protein